MNRWILGLGQASLLLLLGCSSEASESPTGQPSVEPAEKTVPADVTEAVGVTEAAAQAKPKSPLDQNLDAAQAAEFLKKNEGVVVLDVRTPREFAQGRIAGAVNVDYMAENHKELFAALDRDATYLVHCRSGGRSTTAFALLHDLGFEKIYHLDGGMLAWEKAGNPVEK